MTTPKLYASCVRLKECALHKQWFWAFAGYNLTQGRVLFIHCIWVQLIVTQESLDTLQWHVGLGHKINMSTEWNINMRRDGRVKGKRKRVPPAPCCWWLGGACWGGTWECWTARATQRPSPHPERCSHPPSHTRQMLLMQPENTSNKQSRAYTTGSVHCRDSSHLCDTTHTCWLIWDKQWPGTLSASGECLVYSP